MGPDPSLHAFGNRGSPGRFSYLLPQDQPARRGELTNDRWDQSTRDLLFTPREPSDGPDPAIGAKDVGVEGGDPIEEEQQGRSVIGERRDRPPGAGW
ncbi:MAG: hypothetical protein JWN21_1766 [Sphingomonas bacterium]|nr:hypothetical protein [Sphingomonas bacterium]